MTHFTMYRGESLPMEATVTVDGVADPRQGASAWFTLKKDINDPDSAALVSKTYPLSNPPGEIAASLESGEAVYRWTIEPSDTADLPDASLEKLLPWDFVYKSAGGYVAVIQRGTLTLRAPVTRDTA